MPKRPIELIEDLKERNNQNLRAAIQEAFEQFMASPDGQHCIVLKELCNQLRAEYSGAPENLKEIQGG